MFHEDFDKSTHNSFFSTSAHGHSINPNQPSLSGFPTRTPSHLQQQIIRDRLPPIQTQLLEGTYNPHRRTHSTSNPPPNGVAMSPTGRSSTTSPDSYFAHEVIAKFNKRREREKMSGAAPELGNAALAGLTDTNPPDQFSQAEVAARLMRGFAPVKTNTSSALGAVGSSGVGVLSDIGADKERERREREERRKERREKKDRKEKRAKEKEGKRKHKDKDRKKDKSKGEATADNDDSAQRPPNLLVPVTGPLHPSLNPHSPHALFNPMSSSTPVDGLGAPIPDFGSRSATPTSANPAPTTFSYSQTPQHNTLLTNLAPDYPPAQPTASTSQFVLPPEMTVESPQPLPEQLPNGQPVGVVVPGVGVLGIGRPPDPQPGPSRPPVGQRQASLPEYSALDPYASFGPEAGYGVGLNGAPTRLSTVNEKSGDSDGGSTGSSSKDYGTSFRSRRQTGEFTGEDGEDVSIIGSGAEDLRPNGVPLPLGNERSPIDDIDVNGGAMINPSKSPQQPQPSSHPQMMPMPQPTGVPPPPIPSTSANANNNIGNDANWPSSRDSALLKCPPQTILGLLHKSEAEYATMENLYTQAVAETGYVKHLLEQQREKWEKEKKALEELVRGREEEAREMGERVREVEKRSKAADKERKKRESEVKDLRAALAEKDREIELERERRARDVAARRAAEEALAPTRERAVELEHALRETRAKAREQISALETEKEDIRASLSSQLAAANKAFAELNSAHTVMKLENEQAVIDYQRAKQAVGNLEGMLAKAQEEAAEARRGARRIKAEAGALLAKEQGRREGWEEGMKRGRGMAEALAVGVGVGVGMSSTGGKRLVGDGMAYIEEVPGDRTKALDDDEEEEERRRRERKRKAKEKEKEKERSRIEEEKHQQEKSALLSRLAELESSIAAERSKTQTLLAQKTRAASEIGSVVERVYELEGRLEREKAERQLEVERLQHEKEMEKDRLRREAEREKEAERRRLEDELRRVEEEQRRREQARAAEEEEERRRRRKREEEDEEAERTRRRQREKEEEEEKEKEREREKARKAEQEALLNMTEAERKKKEEEAAALRAQLEKEKEEKEKLKSDLAAAKTPVITLSYLPMPPPPQPPSARIQEMPPGVPSSSASSTRRRRRREREGSGSDTQSEVDALNILRMPGFDDNPRDGRSDRDRRRKGPPAPLGTIHEMPSVNSFASPGGYGAPPSWVSNPPPNLAQGGMPMPQSYMTPGAGMGMPRPEDYLSPPDPHGGRPELRKMTSGSTSGSSWDIRVVPPSRPDSAMNNAHGPDGYTSPHPYLSPGGGPPPPQPRIPGPYDRPPTHGDIPTAPSSPYHGAGGLPPGFVPTPGAMPMPTVGGRNVDRGVEISAGGGSSMRPDAGRMMPQPTSSMRADAGAGMPGVVVPGRGESSMAPGAGSGMPQPMSSMRADAGAGMPRPASSMRGDAGAGMPEPVIPGKTSSRTGRPPSSMGGGPGGMSFPEPTVPIYGVPGSARSQTGSVSTRTPGTGYGSAQQTPSGGMSFPEPTVPGILPPGSAAGGGTVGFPTPTIPNIVADSRTPRGGSTLNFPEPTVPNIVPSPGPAPAATLRSTKKKTDRKGKKAAGLSMPEPTVPDIVPRGGPSPMFSNVPIPNTGGMTPPPAFPPVIPKIPGGMDFGGGSPSAPPAAMPTPTVVDYTGGSRTPGSVMPVLPASAGMTMPTPSIRGTPVGEGPPVIPGVTTSVGRGGMFGDASTEPPFIPPKEVVSRAESRNSNANSNNGGGGGSLFGTIGRTFGGGGWGGWGSSGGNNNDEEEGDGEFGGGGGGFIPPGVRDAMEDDNDVDSATERNTKMNAQMGSIPNNGFETKKKKGKKRK